MDLENFLCYFKFNLIKLEYYLSGADDYTPEFKYFKKCFYKSMFYERYGLNL